MEASFSHISTNFLLSPDEDHGTRGRYEAGLIDAMTLFFFHDDRADVTDQILVGSSLAKQRAQVVIVLAEETGAELTVSRQPDARAMATEGLRHRSDEADFAGRAVGKAGFARRFAALVRDLLERPAGVDPPVAFRGRHDEAARPLAVGIAGRGIP